jgi:hypothetical protein
MAKTKTTAGAADVTQETLDATPMRVAKFLSAVGTMPVVRAALAAAGYTEKDHDQRWALFHAVSGYEAPDVGFQTVNDPKVSAAIATIDAWDEDGFRIVRAALSRLHPAQAKTVLAGIGASTGAQAVIGVRTLLERIDTLAKSKDKGDRAAVATLEARGITKEKRNELAALVKVAEKGTSASPPDASAAKAATTAAAKRQTALVELRAWFEDWSEMARATVKRRDRLIRLGLATRKSPTKSAPTTGAASSANGAMPNASSNGAPASTSS